jgi:hypothetical protein
MGNRLTCRTSQSAARQGAAGEADAVPHHHPLMGCGVRRGTAEKVPHLAERLMAGWPNRGVSR